MPRTTPRWSSTSERAGVETPGGFDIGPWSDRIRRVEAAHDGDWELPVIGPVAAPAAVLTRPDGHVAWTGRLTDPGLPIALATWFGAGDA